MREHDTELFSPTLNCDFLYCRDLHRTRSRVYGTCELRPLRDNSCLFYSPVQALMKRHQMDPHLKRDAIAEWR